MMPPEYDEWVNDNQDDMIAFAKSRGGDCEAVDDAILRTMNSAAFPLNDMTLWWTWHCGAIRSFLSNRARGGARAADLAQEIAGAISLERGTRKTWHVAGDQKAGPMVNKAPLRVYHTEEDKPEGTISQPAMRGWYHVREIARCGRCGLQVRWELEREPYDESVHPTVIPVAACYGCGRREYPKQEALCRS